MSKAAEPVGAAGTPAGALADKDLIAGYYALAAEFAATASPTQLALIGGVAIFVLPLFFGVPIFFLLVGIGVGIYTAFRITSGFDRPDVGELPWKRREFQTLGFLSEDYRPLITSAYEISPKIMPIVDRAVNIIVEQYVENWYPSVSPDDTVFPAACRETLRDVARTFAAQQTIKRPADMLLVLIFSTSNTFVVFLRELRTVIETYGSLAHVHEYIATNSESALAQMVDPAIQQTKYRNAANNILQTFVPVLDVKRSPVGLLAREIIARQVLEAGVESCCNTDTVCSWIIYFLQKEENIKALAQSEMRSREGREGREETPTPAAATTAAKRTSPRAAPAAPSVQSSPASSRASLDASRASVELSPRSRAPPPAELSLPAAPALSSITETASPTFDDGEYDLSTPSQPRTSRVARKPVPSVSALGASLLDGDGDITSSRDEVMGTKPRKLDVSADIGQQRFPAGLDDDGYGDDADPSLAYLRSDASSAQPSVLSRASTATSATDETLSPQGSNPSSLYLSRIAVIDSSSDAQTIRTLTSRPSGFYTIVIEPSDASSQGWMAMRSLADFEKLHVVLQKLATLAGLKTFPDVFPPWAGATRAEYCKTLQAYLQLVANTRELADCEAIKKFLDKKDTASVNEKKLFKRPFKNASEGVLDVFNKASAASASAKDGRKTILNVIAAAKKSSAEAMQRTRESVILNSRQKFLLSNGDHDFGLFSNSSHPTYSSTAGAASTTSVADARALAEQYQLPPPPSEIGDNYGSEPSQLVRSVSRTSTTSNKSNVLQPSRPQSPFYKDDTDPSTADSDGSFDARDTTAVLPPSAAAAAELAADVAAKRSSVISAHEPLSQSETNLLVDTMFLAISELYMLSNVWTVRRSLLTMLRGLILRNGSSSLEGIRVAIQKDVLDKYSSEDEMATKLDNFVDSIWGDQPAPTEQDSEALRAEARRMFITGGVPDAIKSVMGAAASAKALEAVFDVLQDQNITRGLIQNLLMDVITTFSM
ncbi:PXA domain-containing protein [Dipodascopsis tothii]|uniref:PXA domain-containing protein n=1 Tax=Dipodascopsis tothii TaxID=44089 RepID=UPI0034CDC2F3